MRRSTSVSANFRLLRSGLAGAFVLATILSCAESVSPTEGLDGVIRVKVNSVDIFVHDSVKLREAAEFSAMFPNGLESISANFVGPAFSLSGSACGGGGADEGYSKAKVTFAPENIPNIAPFPLSSDGYIPDSEVPLGFNFTFFGKTYDRVNVHMNGFLVFGPFAPAAGVTYWRGETIHSTNLPNNIIALAWTDWNPKLVPDGIRWETRGTAPRRKFILQYNNVPEQAGGVGRLTSQVVLEEGTNEITIYTTTMTVKNTINLVTQGIENSMGTLASYDSVTNSAGRVNKRVRNFFSLTNDALRFTPLASSDDQAPAFDPAPSDIVVGNDPGLASAVVVLPSPVAKDNCSEVTLSSARSDNKALDAPYPVGVTTITWTATDAAGNSTTATQSVTVEDREDPVFDAGANSDLELNATSPNGAVVTFGLGVTDNVAVTSLVCEPASGSVFPIGPNPVSCEARDAAGNSSTKSFSVNVIGAREQIQNLIGEVKDLPLPGGTANPLMNQLKAALENEDNSCKKVTDFIDMVTKKGLEQDLADALILEATRIMGALGCGESSGANN